MNEAEVLHEIGIAVEAPKVAGDPTGWKAGNGTNRLFLVLPLDVAASSQGTCRLVFRATSTSPDRDVIRFPLDQSGHRISQPVRRLSEAEIRIAKQSTGFRITGQDGDS